MSRRQSVVDAYGDIELKIRTTVSKLSELWDEVSMSENMRVKRISTVFAHINDLCENMVESEKAMVETLKESISNDTVKVQKMREELGKDPFVRSATLPHNSIALMRLLESEVKALEATYLQKKMDQEALLQRLHTLSIRLGVEDVILEQEVDKLFNKEIESSYEAMKAEWEETMEYRLQKMKRTQADLRLWRKCCESLRREVAKDDLLKYALEVDLDTNDCVLSLSNVEMFHAFHSEFQPLYEQYAEEMEFRWTEKYRELSDLWGKCHVSIGQHDIDEVFVPGKHTEDEFQEMCDRVETLQKMFAIRQPVYGSLERWKRAWAEKVELDEKRKDPAYYQSRERGHSVMRDTKRERGLNESILPRLKNEVGDAYTTYLLQYPDQEILVDGMTPTAYIDWMIEEYDRVKEIERLNKMEAKKQELEATRMHSPAPRTPQANKRNNQLFRTPMSASKIEPCVKRLRFDSTLTSCRSPSASNLLSVINPVRAPPAGPKHSSPKEEKEKHRAPLRAVTPSSHSKKPPNHR